MRNLLLAGCLLLFCVPMAAQHTEISAGLNSGMLSFRGRSAVSSSFVVVDADGYNAYTNDLYSKKPGIGIGVDISVLHVGKKRFIYGIATGLELLKHNIPIKAVSYPVDTYPATGTARIHSRFINVRPIAGYRFKAGKKATLDIAGSLEIAIGLSFMDEVGMVTITSSGKNIQLSRGRDYIITDIRSGLQAKLNVKRFSLLTGYWLGQSNFYKGYSGGSPEAYSKLFRLGLSYRLNRAK